MTENKSKVTRGKALKRRLTAQEFMRQLRSDPVWVAKKCKADAELRREEAKLAREESRILKDLHAAGSSVESVWDLVNSRKQYPELVPVLLKHLNHQYSEKVREGIARALAVKRARIGWKQLVRAYIAEEIPRNLENDNQVKWALHLAIAVAADESVVDELISLTISSGSKGYRSSFVEALDCMKSPQAKATIDELKGEPDLEDTFGRLERNARRRKSRK